MDLNGTAIKNHTGEVNGKNHSHNGHHNGSGHINGKDKFQNEYPLWEWFLPLTSPV